jgi:lipopolysaccharide export system protein LptA
MIQMRLILVLLAFCLPFSAFAQAQIAFGGLKHDPRQPVEIASDKLQVSQTDGTATFIGNVIIGQGSMRLAAAKVLVEYDTNGSDIRRLIASGGVTLVNGAEAAESREATYTIFSGIIVMTGSVLLTQGPNALSSQKLTIDLKNGTGTMDGRVKSIIQTGKK